MYAVILALALLSMVYVGGNSLIRTIRRKNARRRSAARHAAQAVRWQEAGFSMDPRDLCPDSFKHKPAEVQNLQQIEPEVRLEVTIKRKEGVLPPFEEQKFRQAVEDGTLTQRFVSAAS
jgi:hypothetical protein